MNRIKVAIVLPYFGGGGAEKMAAQLAAGIDSGDFRVEVFCVYGQPQDNHLERMLIQRGVPIHFIEKKRGFSLKAMGRIFRLLDEFGPDVVHTHLYACVYTAPWPVLRRKPWLHTFHTLPHIENRRLLRRLLTRLCVGMGWMQPVAISRSHQRMVADYYKLDPAAVPVIHNPVDVSRFEAARQCKSGQFCFITAGRFSPEKNQAMMLRAFAGFLEKGHDARLVLLGTGALEAELRKLARELDIERRADFAGFVENVQDYLVNADVFLLSSDYEALPLSVLEAMAAGLPVIATDVGGLRDIVTDNGILLPSGDQGGMTNAMKRLYEDPILRHRMGLTSKNYAVDYDVSATVDGYCRLYRRYGGVK